MGDHTPPLLILFWDYDAQVGQINSSLSYKREPERYEAEFENVNYLLDVSKKYDFPMCFAVTGYSVGDKYKSEALSDQLVSLVAAGNEVASHSWKHEWFPFLSREQMGLTLQRSMKALDSVLDRRVSGFVPPFTRPQTWIKRGCYSFGDRGLWPFFWGGDFGNVVERARATGYQWIRAGKCMPLTAKLSGRSPSSYLRQPFFDGDMLCIPGHRNGFDSQTNALMEHAARNGLVLAITAHPLGLSRDRRESLPRFKSFLDTALSLRDQYGVRFETPEALLGT